MSLDREWLLLNRLMASGKLTDEEMRAFVHWLLLPEDEIDKEDDDE